MKVLKFGGTSVGTPRRMQEVLKIVDPSGESKLLVLSAMAGTTDQLKQLSTGLEKGQPEEAGFLFGKLKENYREVAKDLFRKKKFLEKGFRLDRIPFWLYPILFRPLFSGRCRKKPSSHKEN